ncbi:MAG: uracil-DNA glycosylase family protein [Pseudomonadales bacterium]
MPKAAIHKPSTRRLIALSKQVSACRLCSAELAHEPRPVFAAGTQARLLIVGQAPGRKVHESGVPWQDASGKRLREWLSVSDEQFYDDSIVALLPMGFCYPGKGKSGDLPPQSICAPTWHDKLLAQMPNIELTLLVGQYAQQRYLPETAAMTLTERVKNWRSYAAIMPLPHPSPRNQPWLKKHAWFEAELVPELQIRVRQLLQAPGG